MPEFKVGWQAEGELELDAASEGDLYEAVDEALREALGEAISNVTVDGVKVTLLQACPGGGTKPVAIEGVTVNGKTRQYATCGSCGTGFDTRRLDADGRLREHNIHRSI